MATNAVKVRGANVARQVWANKSVIVANIRGNTTVKCNTMRAALGESNASMKFMKNSMAVAGLDATPERAMSECKAWSTRRLREAGLVGSDERVWTRHGSTRYLWDRASLDRAIAYVRNQ